ncbi:uncharacterized protein LOC135147089 [Daucus carota subsp. sativus]|uniref:uncharacterized protein LOC135147089 n=1 Tax=Daucus carota subsp. sativus TaxID=79200 RepID=UPI003083603A
MEVYRIPDLTKCRLLAATVRDDAHHWASVTYAPSTNTLANIKQKEDETLREYFKRFNSEVPRVRPTSKETLKNFLIAGVRPGTEFWKELQGREPKTLADFFARAEPYKIIEESLAKLKKESKFESRSNWKRKRDRSYSPERRNTYKRNPYTRPTGEKPSSRDGKTSPITVNATSTQGFDKSRLTLRKTRDPRYNEYTPLTASIEHIFEVGDKARLFRKPFRNGPPGNKDQEKYCAFHDLNGHETAECVHLKDHIEDLIRSTGYLTEFVAQEAKKYKDQKAEKANEQGTNRNTRAGSVQMIIGGPFVGGQGRSGMKRYVREARGQPLTNVCHLSERPPKMFKGETMDITFTEGDARTVHHPHSDALVVSAVIGNINVHRLLVDNGSSVNILAYSAYQRMKMADKDMMACYNELYGFTGNAVQIIGRVRLPITLGVEPLATTQVAEFMIVNEDISYNGILGRPIVRHMRIVTSIYHLSMKFPTPNGVGCVQGCQADSRECYSRALRSAVKACKEVQLVDGGIPENYYKQVEPEEKPEAKTQGKILIKFLKETCNLVVIVQHPGEDLYLEASYAGHG